LQHQPQREHCPADDDNDGTKAAAAAGHCSGRSDCRMLMQVPIHPSQSPALRYNAATSRLPTCRRFSALTVSGILSTSAQFTQLTNLVSSSLGDTSAAS